MKRRKMSKSNSKRDFKKKTGTHVLNKAQPRTMRGGIRL